MAIYHFSGQVISRGNGKSAMGAAAYRSGTELHDEYSGLTFDYSHKTGVDFSEIMTPDFAPPWASERAQLWNRVEKSEKRKDAQTAREFNAAVPVELTHEQKIALVRGFVKEQFTDSGFVADVNHHHMDGNNPHVHIQTTMRDLLPSGEFNPKKNRDLNSKEQLNVWREAWATHVNRALELAGVDQRVDHRTLEAQGIDREAQIHVGPVATAMERKGIPSERGQMNRDIIERNEVAAQLRSVDEAIAAQRLAAGDVRGAAVADFSEKIVLADSPGPVVLNTSPPVEQPPERKRPTLPPDFPWKSVDEIKSDVDVEKRAHSKRIDEAKRRRDEAIERAQKAVEQQAIRERKPHRATLADEKKWQAYDKQPFYKRWFGINTPSVERPSAAAVTEARTAIDDSKATEVVRKDAAKASPWAEFNTAMQGIERSHKDEMERLQRAQQQLEAVRKFDAEQKAQEALLRRFEQQAQREVLDGSKAPPSPSTGPRL